MSKEGKDADALGAHMRTSSEAATRARIAASDVADTWDMIHDDWRGTLVINPSDATKR